MAELTADPTGTPPSCCSADTQATCCEPAEKTACCGERTSAGNCGCAPGQNAEPASAEDIRVTVRERYAVAARAVSGGDSGPCGCGCGCGCARLGTTNERGAEVFGSVLYDEAVAEGATATAVAASLGCGVPTAVADLHAGETVLDLGSGAGADVLISAGRVGATGRVIGLDMTDEMLAFARANAAQAGVTNVEFVRGYIEDIPLPDASVDVIVSNCVVNLSADKPGSWPRPRGCSSPAAASRSLT